METSLFLRTLGCCDTCSNIFQGEFEIGNSKNPKEEETVEQCPKKNKNAVCISCLGVFQYGISQNAIDKIANFIITEDYDAEEFTVCISMPMCTVVRVGIIWAKLLQNFPDHAWKICKEETLSRIKDVWRTYVGNAISKKIGKLFVKKQVVAFNVSVTAVYEKDEEDCKILEKLDAAIFEKRRVQHRKYSGQIFSRQIVDKIIQSCPEKQLLEVIGKMPDEPMAPIELKYMQCTNASLFVAGRYRKYCRELPQTPWFVDNARRLESSVEELIVNPINQLIKASDTKFCSSGREDVDVRCLGDGRPFVVEFLNPKRVYVTQDEMFDRELAVNNSTKRIDIRQLQVVSRDETSVMKVGDETKIKFYCALCIARDGYIEEKLSDLDSIKDLVIHQETPVRVLHRRPKLNRPRTIHSMKTLPIDGHFFKLYLKTQAGTYIKEFVHGDFGRTVPNLSEMLQTPVDIIGLDVENVEMDWPPRQIIKS